MRSSYRTNSIIKPIPKLSYAQDSDSWLKKKVVNFIEVASGRDRITAIYDDLKGEPFQIPRFFSRGIELGKLELSYNRAVERKIPQTGPLVFIANHPFGIIDGLILCEIASRLRGDFRILLNNRLMKDEDLNSLFLPIDFDGTPEAARKNVETKRDAQQVLDNGGTIIIFPSGGVSTRRYCGLGRLEEFPWTTFAAKIIMKAKAAVVPVYFQGENSFSFHFASGFSETARLSLFINEVTRRMGSKIEFTIGKPIPYTEIEEFSGRKALTEQLKKKVDELSPISKGPR